MILCTYFVWQVTAGNIFTKGFDKAVVTKTWYIIYYNLSWFQNNLLSYPQSVANLLHKRQSVVTYVNKFAAVLVKVFLLKQSQWFLFTAQKLYKTKLFVVCLLFVAGFFQFKFNPITLEKGLWNVSLTLLCYL